MEIHRNMSVYFIADNENGDYGNLRIKIGISQSIKARLNKLQTGSPYKLKLMGWIESDDDRVLEKELHSKYDKYRVHLEWFEFDVCNVLEIIKSHTTNGYPNDRVP